VIIGRSKMASRAAEIETELEVLAQDLRILSASTTTSGGAQDASERQARVQELLERKKELEADLTRAHAAASSGPGRATELLKMRTKKNLGAQQRKERIMATM